MTRVFTVLMVATSLAGALAAQSAALRIVVVEGEGAVNIIQQKTAVAPVVEVRDRNDQPVAGAVVTFTVRGGRLASFAGGGQTVTVTTNAAGRAAAAALNPLARGGFQIQVQAAFQGHMAAAAIAQTNVLTAAEAAAAAGSSTGGAGTAGSAGASGGGGMSATTIGVVGGAVAAGAVAATTLTGSEDAGPAARTFSGPYRVQFVMTVTNPDGSSPCTHIVAYSGTLRMQFTDQAGAISGTAEMDGSKAGEGTTCGGLPAPGVFFTGVDRLTLSGTPAAVTFDRQTTGTAVNGVTIIETLAFTGALGQDSIAGTLTVSRRETGGTAQAPRIGTGTGSVQVTLR